MLERLWRLSFDPSSIHQFRPGLHMNLQVRTATDARSRADSKENLVHLGLTSLCALAAVVGKAHGYFGP
jgi:hypothetical protein